MNQIVGDGIGVPDDVFATFASVLVGGVTRGNWNFLLQDEGSVKMLEQSLFFRTIVSSYPKNTYNTRSSTFCDGCNMF